MRSLVSVRSFVDSDKPRISELYAEAFGEEQRKRFERRWSWQFEENPAHALAPSQLWVAELDDRVVGHLASFPTRFQIAGSNEILYHDCDLLVAPEARRRGIGQRLVEAYDALEENPFSNALGNYTSVNRRIRERLGYQPIELSPSRALPLSGRAYTLFALRTKRSWRRFERGPGYSVARALGELGFRAARRASRLASRRVDRTVEVRSVVRSGPEFDELWETAKADIAHLAVRDSEFVDWRFFRDPVHECSVLGAYRETGLVGYLAFAESQEYGLRVGRVLDAFSSIEDRAVLGPLLAEAIRRLRDRGVDIVRCLGLNPRFQEVVAEQLPFAPARLQRPSWLRVPAGASRSNPAQWHVSYADSDLAFG